ncbi:MULTISPECIES: DUF4393 domain-containing protein [Lactobacillales]|uniref:DUF4393 domain-containing protein n=1 Tax=Lactobacillales TaxID=186826 RepID=UPI002FCC9705
MLELIPTIATSFATAMLSNAFSNAQGPAQALDDLMALSGFEKLHLHAEKKRAKTEINIQSYKEAIAQELIQIPEENIQEPQMSIVGPALEASKYYIEEKEIREMFAKLIASSMNKAKSNQVHPSFVEVIKQLSSKEAILLKNLNDRNPFGRILSIENKEKPSLDNFLSNETENDFDLKKMFGRKSKTIMNHFYYSNNSQNYFENDFSISALSRLGLINVGNDVLLSDDNVYLQLDNAFEYFKNNEFSSSFYEPNFSLELEKGSLDITPFGLSFRNSCIE